MYIGLLAESDKFAATPPHLVRSASCYKTHPDYSYVTQENDVALIYLKVPVTPGWPTASIASGTSIPSTLDVAGWGATNDPADGVSYTFPDVLQGVRYHSALPCLGNEVAQSPPLFIDCNAPAPTHDTIVLQTTLNTMNNAACQSASAVRSRDRFLLPLSLYPPFGGGLPSVSRWCSLIRCCSHPPLGHTPRRCMPPSFSIQWCARTSWTRTRALGILADRSSRWSRDQLSSMASPAGALVAQCRTRRGSTPASHPSPTGSLRPPPRSPLQVAAPRASMVSPLATRSQRRTRARSMAASVARTGKSVRSRARESPTLSSTAATW